MCIRDSLERTPDGGFLLTYHGYNTSTGTYDILLQRYANSAPNIQDVTVSGLEDSPIVLTDELFASGFIDPEGQALAAIKIVELPAEGTLRLDGVPVTVNQEIAIADLAADKLTYQGKLNYNGPDLFRWNGSDGITFARDPVFTRITVINVNDAPGLEAGPPGTGSEGSSFSRAITLADPDKTDTILVTVAWVGSGGQSGSYQLTSGPGTPSISFTPPDDGSYAVTVTANDQQGQPNSIQTDSFTVAVANVAPSIALTGADSVEAGQTYLLYLGLNYWPWTYVVDPGTDTVVKFIIHWGDGTPAQEILLGDVPADRQIPHTFATAGAPTITIDIVDEDGQFNSVGSKLLTVTPPPEVLSLIHI